MRKRSISGTLSDFPFHYKTQFRKDLKNIESSTLIYYGIESRKKKSLKGNMKRTMRFNPNWGIMINWYTMREIEEGTIRDFHDKNLRDKAWLWWDRNMDKG